MLVLLIQCMYLTKSDFGRLGSGFLIYKYSAICLKTPIELNLKVTVNSHRHLPLFTSIYFPVMRQLSDLEI